MAEYTLLLSPDDIIRLTGLSGTIDLDKLTPFIRTAQRNEIRRILGYELYNKILLDYENDDLTGEYKIIYDEFIVDMLVYFSASDYIKMGTYAITDGGIFKYNPENGETVDINEIKSLVSSYKSLGNAIELLFKDYIKGTNITEYRNNGCDNNSSFGANWYF